MQVLNFPSPYRAGETPYDIFKDRMTAVGTIVGGIKNIISNKYINKQLNMIADNILNQVDENKANELVNLINEPPPEEIYPSGLEDTVGQFYDFVTHPKVPQTQISNLPDITGSRQNAVTGLLSQGVNNPNQMLDYLNYKQSGEKVGDFNLGEVEGMIERGNEAMIPKGDIFQLFNAVKSMPSGQVNWANLLKTMTAKKPYFMGTTGAEEFVMNQMLSQVKNPKEELEKEINLTKLIQETFYPEEEKPTEWDKRLDVFLQTNPTVDEVKKFVGGYIEPDKLSDFDKRFNLLMQTEPSVDEVKKFLGTYITPETKLSVKDILANIPEGFEIGSFNTSTTGATSFSFKPIGTTTAWEFNTWDEAQEFLRTHPQEGFIGKIETHGKGFDVTWNQEGTTEKVTTTEVNFVDEKFKDVKTNVQYDEALNKVRLVDKSIPVPSRERIFKDNYDKAMFTIKSFFDMGIIDNNGTIKKGNPTNSLYSYEMLYAQEYDDLQEAIQEYQKVTGQTLQNPFLSFEEYQKSDKTKWYNPTTWTSRPSVNQ